MELKASKEFAEELDQADPLKHYRNKFYIPQHNGRDTIYLCGNSLGLQPKSAKEHILRDLENWEKLGVEGHFTGEYQWVDYHKRFRKPIANLVGAKESEVVVMTDQLQLALFPSTRTQR